MNKKLVICAHPDDETLFFTSQLTASTKVICVTDANADGRGDERQNEFKKAMKTFGVKDFEMWDFKDIFKKRLDLEKLITKIKELGNFEEVYTHGPIGEYGHPHHQDVCFATYESFPAEKIWVHSYNTFPQMAHTLSLDQFKTKEKVLTHIYGKETSRFLNLIPITNTETYIQVTKKEVDSIYNFLIGKNKRMTLDKYQGLKDTIINCYKNSKRAF